MMCCVKNAFGIRAIGANLVSGESVNKINECSRIIYLLNEMRKFMTCDALPRMLSFIINKWNIVQ